MHRLSIIIPCYNSSQTIGKVLDSILNNNLEKDIYEVIIADDNSTDNFMDIVNTYNDRMNIVYCKTDTEVHCPGNTRETGLNIAKGEWITFIDHDDYFQPNIFNRVLKNIDDKKLDTVFCTSFYGITGSKKHLYDNIDNTPWLHGKFYNHKMLLDGNIHFMKDLKTHEDVYFNNKIEMYLLINKRKMWFNFKIITYNWVQRKESLSHQVENGMTYMDNNFKDYILATFEPLFDIPNMYIEFKKEYTMKHFLMFYFTFQQGYYRFGDKYANINFDAMRRLKERIYKELRISSVELLDFIYANPEYYNALKLKVFTNIDCPFIEQQSFRDFVLSIDYAINTKNQGEPHV